jgi:hypothetical protein
MYKKIYGLMLTVFMLSVSTTAFAAAYKNLSNYPELLTALKNGHGVRAIIQINTTPNDIESKHDVIGAMNFTQFNKYPIVTNGQVKNGIATSINMLVQHKKYGFVYDYVRLRVFEDNSAELFSAFLNPKTYAQLQSITFYFQLNDKKAKNKIVLYDLV